MRTFLFDLSRFKQLSRGCKGSLDIFPKHKMRVNNFGQAANFFPLLVGPHKTKPLEIEGLKSFRTGHIKCTQLFLVISCFLPGVKRRGECSSGISESASSFYQHYGSLAVPR